MGNRLPRFATDRMSRVSVSAETRLFDLSLRFHLRQGVGRCIQNMADFTQKEQFVDALAERLAKSKSTIVTDYRGLSVAEVTELRRLLREAGVEYEVIKNTMTRRAAAKAQIEGVSDMLTGPNAIAFGYEDVVVPAKVLFNFAKGHKALELKGGVVEGRVVSASEVASLATLPTREGLLSMLLSVLQAPMRNLAYAVQQIADQQPTEQQAEQPTE